MYKAHTNAWGSKFDFAVEKSNVNVGSSFLQILADLLSPRICAKTRPQGLYCFEEEDF